MRQQMFHNCQGRRVTWREENDGTLVPLSLNVCENPCLDGSFMTLKTRFTNLFLKDMSLSCT